MNKYLSTQRITGLCTRANHPSNNNDNNSNNDNNNLSLAGTEVDGESRVGCIKNEGLVNDKEKEKDQGPDDQGCVVREGVFDDTLLTMTEPYQTADW